MISMFWVKILGGLAVLTALVGSGYFAGQRVERSSWLQRENKELSFANTKIHELEEQNRALEHKAADDVNRISTELEDKHAKAETESDRIIADLRSGNTKLRVALTTGQGAGTSKPGTTPTDPTKCSREARTGFLAEADGTFLVGEANRADEIVLQLSACQTILVEDRKIANQP